MQRTLILGLASLVLLASNPRPYPFDRLIDVSIAIDAAASAQLRKNADAEVPARLRVPDEAGRVAERAVSLKIKGGFGSRRALDEKPAFKIAFAQGERLFGLEQFTLNNMVQDHTMVHEALGYQFYDALGVPVPRTGYARVRVNGEAYGLYLNLESIDKTFLKRRFNDDTGVLYEGAYGADLRESDIGTLERHIGSDPDAARLRSFVQAVNAPGDAVFYGDRPLIDVHTFLKMTAAEGLIEDWDSYYHSNNYRIYWIPSAGRWAFIPTGIDQSFVFNDTPAFGATGLLLQKCLASDRCRREYESAMTEVVERFEQMNMAPRLDEILRLIGPASEQDTRRPYDTARMNGARDRLRSFIEGRPRDVRATLACVGEERAGVLGACAGVIVQRAENECLEVVPDDSDDNAGGVGIAPCTGTFNERWRVQAASGRARLSPVSDAHKCVSVQEHEGGAKLAWTPCESGNAAPFAVAGSDLRLPSGDLFHIRRSIFER